MKTKGLIKQPSTIVFAALFTIAVLILGYIMLGLLPMFLFAFGFLGGFVLWLLVPTQVSFASVWVFSRNGQRSFSCATRLVGNVSAFTKKGLKQHGNY